MKKLLFILFLTSRAFAQNMLNMSEQLDNAAWVDLNVTVTANAVNDPNGFLTADEITSTSAAPSIYEQTTVLPSSQYTFSFYALRGTLTNMSYATYDATHSAVISGASYFSSTNSSTWTRISVTFTTPAGCTQARCYPISNSGLASSETCFIWGAQLNPGSSAATYQKTPYVGTFYIAAAGSDANTGMDITHPWKTAANYSLYANTLTPGDHVSFNRGDTFRVIGTLPTPVSGTSGDSVYYDAYGTGAKPLLLGSVQENSTGNWTNISGNIWRCSDPLFTVDVGNFIFNNEASTGTKVMSVSSPTLTFQGQFWYDYTNHWVNMYSVGNPASFYTNIEAALEYDAINPTGITYIKFNNLDFRYWAKCVWEVGGDFLDWDAVDLSYIGGGDFQNSHTSRFGNGLQIWQGHHDITIKNCHISNVADAGISPQGTAIGGGFTAYNIFIRNNVIDKCEYGFEFFENDSSTTIHDVYFENNTVTNPGHGWEHYQRAPYDTIQAACIRIYQFDAARSNIFIRNNILYNSMYSLWYIRTNTLNGPVGPDSSDLHGMTIDYNDEYQPPGSTGIFAWVNWNSRTFTTLSQWQSATDGQEAHSISVDPLFVSTADDHLTGLSPCIDAGVNTGQPFQGNAPDIGAFEYPTIANSIIYGLYK